MGPCVHDSVPVDRMGVGWRSWILRYSTIVSASRPLRVVSDVGGTGRRLRAPVMCHLALDTTRYCSLSRRSCAQHLCIYQASGRDELSRTLHLFFFHPESVDVVWSDSLA